MNESTMSPKQPQYPRCPCHRMTMKYMHAVTVQGVQIGLYVCAMGSEYADYGPVMDDKPGDSEAGEMVAA